MYLMNSFSLKASLLNSWLLDNTYSHQTCVILETLKVGTMPNIISVFNQSPGACTIKLFTAVIVAVS
jgi:hypothetical protein